MQIKQTLDLYWCDLALNIDLFTNVQVFEKQRVPPWQPVNINYKKRSKSCDNQLWNLKFANKWELYMKIEARRKDLLAAKQTWRKRFKFLYVFNFRKGKKMQKRKQYDGKLCHRDKWNCVEQELRSFSCSLSLSGNSQFRPVSIRYSLPDVYVRIVYLTSHLHVALRFGTLGGSYLCHLLYSVNICVLGATGVRNCTVTGHCLQCSQIFQEIPAFYCVRSFFTMFAQTHELSLACARLFRLTFCHHVSL